jgi:hypothetical protein
MITPKFLSLTLLLVSVVTSYATTNTTDINLSFTHTNYVNLTGTVVGASRTFSENDVKPVGNGFGPKVSLGTLGLESNMLGACTITFTTANNYRLRHIVSNKRLAAYRLFYRGTKLRKKNNHIDLPSCNLPPRKLKLSTKKNFRQNVAAGIYRDIITITVTTQ